MRHSIYIDWECSDCGGTFPDREEKSAATCPICGSRNTFAIEDWPEEEED